MTDSAVHFVGKVVTRLLAIAAEGDFFSLVVALAVFWCVGHAVIKRRPELRAFGHASGLIGFLGFVAWQAATFGISDGQTLAATAVRGLFVGGCATAAGWVSAVILVFLYEHTLGHASRLLDPHDR